MGAVIALAAGLTGVASGAWAMRRWGRLFGKLPVSPFADILESLGTAYYRHDMAHGSQECSARLKQLLGLSDSAYLFSDITTALGEPHGTAIMDAIKNARQTRAPVIVSMALDKRQIECTATMLFDKGGTAMQLILWFRDITISQKQQVRTLKENEQLKRDIKQFSSILNVLPMPVWLRTEDLSIRYCNMAYSEAAEESPVQRSEHQMPELHPQGAGLARAAADADAIKSERRHIIVGGTRKLYQFTEIPLKGDKLMVGIAYDATELETVQEDLQRHITAQSELLESVTSAVAVFGSDMRLKFFNYAYVHLWGFDEAWLDTAPTYSELLEELREKRRLPEQANFPLFKQRHLKLFTDLIEPQEEIFYLPDGRTLRVLAIPHALGGILFAYEDVTDRLALERSYNTLSLVQKATLDNLHEGVVVFGEDGRLRLYNPKFIQLWHLEQAVLSPETHVADLIEKTRRLHNVADWDEYKQKFIAQLLEREIRHRRIERNDGSVIDSMIVPLPDGATLITFSDITASTLVERSLLERNEALQEADRLKTEFLANVSYELRSPLTSISGFSEMLSQDYFGELSPKQREYVAGIHQASQHLMHLINDILDIASIEAGYMKLDVQEFDIHTMLQSVVALVHERIREHQIQFTFNCSRRIGKMLADETRMKQIMFNLLSNAIKYSQIGGCISLNVEAVKSEPGEDDIVFSIEDNGIGITPEEQKAVFSKFFKGSNIGIHTSGTGLGLSMVKSFIELHGGTVELHSKPGEGTKIVCRMIRRNPILLEHSKAA